MPTFTFDCHSDAELASLRQAALFIAELHQLAQTAPDGQVLLAAGRKVYAENCAVCHAPDGKGNKELGAPDLTDGIWLFGSGEDSIIEVIANSRGGVMPAWKTGSK